MATISDKLIQLKNIKQDIKEATNNLGGNVGDDFSTYAEAINRFATYENPNFYADRTAGGTNFNNLFRGYDGPDIDVSNWDTSKVTSARYCFSECTKSMDISNWDLSSLTNASYMFNYFTNNNKYLDLSVLDFSNVKNVTYMFTNSNTDYLDVRNIDLSSANDYSNLFSNCGGTELDLSGWDVSNVTSFNSMFNNAKHKKIDLTGWKTTNATNFYYMFSGYSNATEELIIPDWDMTNATSTTSFFYSSPKIRYIDLSRSNDTTITKMASLLPTRTATTYGEMLVPVDTSQDAINAVIAKYWKPIGPKFDLISTKLVFELDEIKPGKTTKVYTYNNDPWYGDDRPETIEFVSSDESVATINGKEIAGVSEGTIEITARRRDTQEVISTAPVTLTVSNTDSNPNLIKVRLTSAATSGTILTVNNVSVRPTGLTYDNTTNIYSYDPGKQITSIRFNNGSYDGYTTEIVKFNFNAANITNMTEMFRGYQGTTLDLSDWDTSNVISMYRLFYGSKKLHTINGELDMSNITDIGNNMVSEFCAICPNLETVYLKNIYKNSTMSNNNKWSIDLGDTKVKDSCLLYIINELPNLYDKGLTATDQIVFTLPPTNTLTEEQVQPAIDKGWTVANVNY